MTEPVNPGQTTRKRSWGCIGCLGCLAVPLVIAMIVAVPIVLRLLGIIGPDPEKMFGGAADPVASAAVERSLLEAGVSGARAVVLPIDGRDGQIAIITLEQTSSTEGSAQEAFTRTLQGLAAANREGHRIEQVAIDLRDEEGNPSLGITVGQDAVEAYAAGQISQNEFLGEVEVDLSDLISPEEIRLLLDEVGQ
jgi:hypothetical protein